MANGELGALDAEKAGASWKACDHILAGGLHDQFVIDMFQGGAGTSTNMTRTRSSPIAAWRSWDIARANTSTCIRTTM
jgi:aspartate ammonia-lyase